MFQVSTLQDPKKIEESVLQCVSTFENFKNQAQTIVKLLSGSNPFYIPTAVDTIKKVITGKNYNPKQKFLALYLIVKSSESRNEILIDEIARDNDLIVLFNRQIGRAHV